MFYVLDPEDDLTVHIQIGNPNDRASHENLWRLIQVPCEPDEGIGYDEEAEEFLLTPLDEFLKLLKECSDNFAYDLLMKWEYRLQQEGV